MFTVPLKLWFWCSALAEGFQTELERQSEAWKKCTVQAQIHRSWAWAHMWNNHYHNPYQTAGGIDSIHAYKSWWNDTFEKQNLTQKQSGWRLFAELVWLQKFQHSLVLPQTWERVAVILQQSTKVFPHSHKTALTGNADAFIKSRINVCLAKAVGWSERFPTVHKAAIGLHVKSSNAAC